MKLNLPISGADLNLLRNAAIIAAGCIAVSVVIYLSAQFIDERNSFALNQATENLARVRTSIEQISQEEATIVRYIDRYFLAVEAGTLDDEDRLGFLENIALVRENLQLFPVTVELGGQSVTPLQYSPDDPLPGEPLTLRSSAISLQTGLLHEQELFRLMASLSNITGLLQPTACTLLEQSPGVAFSQVTENVRLDCSFIWYTINLSPDATELAGGF